MVLDHVRISHRSMNKSETDGAKKDFNEDIDDACLDIISFIISTGTIDRLSRKLKQISSSIDHDPTM